MSTQMHRTNVPLVLIINERMFYVKSFFVFSDIILKVFYCTSFLLDLYHLLI